MQILILFFFFFLDMRAIAIALLLLNSTIQPINHVVEEDFRYLPSLVPSIMMHLFLYKFRVYQIKRRKKKKGCHQRKSHQMGADRFVFRDVKTFETVWSRLNNWTVMGFCLLNSRLNKNQLDNLIKTQPWTTDCLLWGQNQRFSTSFRQKLVAASDRSWLRLAGVPLSSSKSTSANLETSSFHSSLLNSCWKIPDSVPGKSLLGPLQFYCLPQVLW